MPARPPSPEEDEDYTDSEREDDEGSSSKRAAPRPPSPTQQTESTLDDDVDPDDPELSRPLPRYNAMLAVLRNTLYIYGGIFERGSREYTLDDFHSLQLDKLDRYVCLKHSGVVISEGDEESSSDEDDDDDDDDEVDRDDVESEHTLAGPAGHKSEDGDSPEVEGEEVKEVERSQDEKDALRAQAAAFMGVAKDATRSAEDVLSTPLPGETLAMFYARSREYWAGKAHASSDNRGKLLRRDGFALAEERYASYKPILEEVERILAEAGLDEEEMRRGAAAGPAGASGQSRNRR